MLRRPPRFTLFPTRRSSDLTSTSVATNGADALAGSKPMRLRTNGSIEPHSEPKVTMPISVAPTVAATSPQCGRSEEHTSELQSRPHLVCRLLLEKKKNKKKT